MPTPTRHPKNKTHWYGNVGRGKGRRIVNLGVPLTEPIEVARAELDRRNAAWEAKQATPKPAPKQGTPGRKTLATLFREYKALKELHYRGKRRGFKNAAARVQKILDACGFQYPADIDGAKVLEYIDGRRGPKFGAFTAEHYRKDFMWFCNWLREKGHLDRRPFGRRDKIKGERHHRRRVLNAAEKARLLSAAAASGRVLRRKDGVMIGGPTRRLIYWTALITGYRFNELLALTPACLQGDCLKLAGEHTKNGDDAAQPLTAALATALREYADGKPATAPLFPRWERGAKMLRVDLKAAGIPYDAPDGIADFHALRHTFCTDLFAAGVDAKTAHVLMRHKSIEMTMSYAKTDDARKLDAVSRLDAPLPPSWEDVPAGGPVEAVSEPSMVERLFGGEDYEALELLGQVTIDESGVVRLAFGPFAGEMLYNLSDFNQGAINPAPETDSPQVVDTEGFESAPRRTRTYNPLIKRENGRDVTACDTNDLRSQTRQAIFRLAINPDFRRVLAAWPTLPDHIRAAVLALVQTAATAAGRADSRPMG